MPSEGNSVDRIASNVGNVFAGLAIVGSGYFMSPQLAYMGAHMGMIAVGSLLYCWGVSKSLSYFKLVLLILAVFAAHEVLLMIEKGEVSFDLRILILIIPYSFVMLFGGIFIPLMMAKRSDSKLMEEGIDAMAMVTEWKDSGVRFYAEDIGKTYKMKLTLRVLGHPQSPYTVTGTFLVSEFFISRLSDGQPIPVKVDKKDHKKVALNF